MPMAEYAGGQGLADNFNMSIPKVELVVQWEYPSRYIENSPIFNIDKQYAPINYAQRC